MKKFLTLALTLLLACSLFGCTERPEGDEQDGGTEHYDVVFLADSDSIYDNGFNEQSLYGVMDFCVKNDLKFTYLLPAGSDDASRVAIFRQAADQMTANVLVAAGRLWDAALCQAIPDYPDTKVIFVDADDLYNIDYDGDGIADSIKHQDNLAMITFAEQDCGYMAGYAVVKDGYRNLAFMGGSADPAVIRFGYGFVAGANDAAEELELEEKAIDMKYIYTGTTDQSSDIAARASEWYAGGTEVIFSCGDSIVYSVLEAAKEDENRKVVGVTTDEYFTRTAEGTENEPLIITSAMKDLETAVSRAVKAAYAGGAEWAAYTGPGMIRMGAAEGASVLAPYREENWNSLSKEEYKAVRQQAAAVHDAIPTEASTSPSVVPVEYGYVNLTYYEQ